MFEQVIESTISQLRAQVIGDADTVSRHDVDHSLLPDGIKRMFALDVQRWVDEATERILELPHFRFDDELQDRVHELARYLPERAFFTREEFTIGLDRAVKLHFNYLCRPQWTMQKFIFDDRENAGTDSILTALESFTEYEYYRVILREYFQKKGLSVLHARKFEDLVTSIDKELSRNLDSLKLAHLTLPLFEFFALTVPALDAEDRDSRTIPMEAAILFYDDKDLPAVVETLERHRADQPDITMHELVLLIGEADIALNLDISSLISHHVDGRRVDVEVPATAAQEYDIPELGLFQAEEEIQEADDGSARSSIERGDLGELDHQDEPPPDAGFGAGLSWDDENAADNPDTGPGFREESFMTGILEEEPFVLPPVDPADEDFDLLLADESLETLVPNDESDADELRRDIPALEDFDDDMSDTLPALAESHTGHDDSSEVPDSDILPTTANRATDVDISLDQIVLADEDSVLPEGADSLEMMSFQSRASSTTSLVMSLDELIAGAPQEKEPLKEDILKALDLDSLDDDSADRSSPAASSLHASPNAVPSVSSGGEARRERSSDAVPAPSAEIIGRFGDLHTLIEASDRKKYIRKLFNRDESAYGQAIDALNGKASWRDASEFIDGLFLKLEVDLYSRLAVKFSDDVYKRYMNKKS